MTIKEDSPRMIYDQKMYVIKTNTINNNYLIIYLINYLLIFLYICSLW